MLYFNTITKGEEKIQNMANIKAQVDLRISHKEIFSEWCRIHGSFAVKLGTDFCGAKNFKGVNVVFRTFTIQAGQVLKQQKTTLLPRGIWKRRGSTCYLPNSLYYRHFRRDRPLYSVWSFEIKEALFWMGPPVVDIRPKAEWLRVRKKKKKNYWKKYIKGEIPINILSFSLGMKLRYIILEPQRRMNNEQWLGKNQARTGCVKKTRNVKTVVYAIYFNSNGPGVQISFKILYLGSFWQKKKVFDFFFFLVLKNSKTVVYKRYLENFKVRLMMFGIHIEDQKKNPW